MWSGLRSLEANTVALVDNCLGISYNIETFDPLVRKQSERFQGLYLP